MSKIKKNSFVKKAAVPLSFAIVIFFFSVGCISCDALLQEKGAYLAGLKTEIRESTRENAALKAEAASLGSSQRIAAVAENELGMVRAEKENISYYVLGEETIPEETDQNAPRKGKEHLNSMEEQEENGGGIFSAVRRLWNSL